MVRYLKEVQTRWLHATKMMEAVQELDELAPWIKPEMDKELPTVSDVTQRVEAWVAQPKEDKQYHTQKYAEAKAKWKAATPRVWVGQRKIRQRHATQTADTRGRGGGRRQSMIAGVVQHNTGTVLTLCWCCC